MKIVSRPIAEVYPALRTSVEELLDKPMTPFRDSTDGHGHIEDSRSEWVWVRLANGDLILGFYPRGEAYMEQEVAVETAYLNAVREGTHDVINADYDEEEA